MQILPLSVRSKQALATLFFIVGIALLLFATQSSAAQADTAPRETIEPSLYDNYVHARPASTTTTSTTLPSKPVKAVPRPIEPAPVSVASGDLWERLRNCEAHGNYATNTGNGYFGAYQFSAATWRSMGTAYAYAHEAPPEVQDDAARRLQARSGWGQWPVCARGFPAI